MFKKKDYKLINQLSGHELFYDDKDGSGYKFLARLNDMYDISVLVFHPDDKTYREFIVDTASFLAIYEFAEDENFTVHRRFVNPGARPAAVRPLIENENYTVIKTGDSKIIKSYIVAKMVEYKHKDEPIKTIDLKRFVVRPAKGSPIVGMDTITMPKPVAESFVEKVRDLFKAVNIEFDLEDLLNEDND